MLRHMTASDVRRGTLSEEIAHQLIQSILDGKFRFGERLPPERDLARYLNVGRPTLREAIRVLSMLGLVDVRHGEGCFVVDRHADFIGRAFSWALLLDSQSVEELIEARVAIESALAALAALRADATQVARLREFVDAMELAGTEYKLFVPPDLGFHLTIAEAARNVTLSRLLFAIQSLLKEWIERALRESQSTFEQAVVQHKAILSAIERRDAEAARLAMALHVQHVGDVIRHASVSPRTRTARMAPPGEPSGFLTGPPMVDNNAT